MSSVQVFTNDQSVTLAKVAARSWVDATFKARLAEDPRGTLAEAGYPVLEGAEIRLLQNTPGVQYVVLPGAPEEDDLAEDDLERVSGGSYLFCCPDA